MNGYTSTLFLLLLNPVSALARVGSEVAPVIGRERNGILSPNHRGYFRPYPHQSGDWV